MAANNSRWSRLGIRGRGGVRRVDFRSFILAVNYVRFNRVGRWDRTARAWAAGQLDNVSIAIYMITLYIPKKMVAMKSLCLNANIRDDGQEPKTLVV